MIHKCKECKNHYEIYGDVEDMQSFQDGCILNIPIRFKVTCCSHFNAKPKESEDTSPQRKEHLEDMKKYVSACCGAKRLYDSKGDKKLHCTKCGKIAKGVKADYKPRKKAKLENNYMAQYKD